jgi:exopolysaccharide biosynthesis WecB/TagA/CpsF family protein
MALFAAVRQRLVHGDGFALATINLDHLVKLSRTESFRRAYAAHDFIVADGNPIVWLSHLARQPVALVPGSDIVVPLSRLAAEMGVPVSLVGTTQDALTRAARRLQQEVPGLCIGELISPPFGFDPNGPGAADILQRIAAVGPGLCFIALSAPKQEVLATQGRKLAPQTGFAGIGAGLDFLAGDQVRAPFWMRAIALEWLWRAITSPGRLIPRYLACAAILPGQVLAAWRMRREV